MNTVVILAGGKSSRMGRDKLSLELCGMTLLQSAVKRFSAGFEQVYISVADVVKYPEISAPRIADIYPGAGPLSGLHAALCEAPDIGVFLTAADMPFTTAAAARRIIELCGNYDACLLRLPDGKLEPLFGYYRKNLLPQCETALQAGIFRMSELIHSANTHFISISDLGALWDDTLLLNVNYPCDYEKIQKLTRPT